MPSRYRPVIPKNLTPRQYEDWLAGCDPVDVVSVRVNISEVTRALKAALETAGGALPDLGEPSRARRQYRKMAGWCVDSDGLPTRWSEWLGRDRELAQHRAAAMLQLWLERLSFWL